MTNFIGILIIGLYLAFSAYFLYLFKQNDFDLKKTLQAIKNKFFKKCKICQMFKNTKKTTETIKIKTEEGEKEIEIVKGDMEDCDAPLGFPFDICFDPKNMTEEDKELREKLAEILRQRKQYIIDGGKKKLIIPLEATQFLTKNLNPLVNEYGEIIIIPKEKPILEQLRHAVFTIKNLDIELTDETEIELAKNLEMLKKLERAHYEKLEKIQERKRKSRKERREKKEKTLPEEKNNKNEKINKNSVNEEKKNINNFNNTEKENTEQEKLIESSSNNNLTEKSKNISIENAKKSENIENKEIKSSIQNIENKKTTESNIENLDKDLTKQVINNNIDDKEKENSVVHAQQTQIETKESKENKTIQNEQSSVKPKKPRISFDIDKLTKTKKENIENKQEDKNKNNKKDNLSNNTDNINKNLEETSKKEENKENDYNEKDINKNLITTALQKAESISQKNEIENKNEIEANKMLNQKKIDMTTIQNFYKKVLEYKHLFEPPIFNEENLVKNLQILNDRIGLSLFFNNLAKTTPLIYTDNKESIFADWKNIYIAFAMLYGAEFKNVITALLKPSMQEKIKFNKALAYVLFDYIDDHFTGENNFCSILVENIMNNKIFRAYGVFFLIKGFKLGLSENQMDFFRSFPYNSPYKIKTVSKGLNLFEKKYPVLVDKANQVLIK